jgi:dienelactone hydrolase
MEVPGVLSVLADIEKMVRIAVAWGLTLPSVAQPAAPATRPEFEPPVLRSSWDDLTDGIRTREDWLKRKPELRRRYLELIRDDRKPQRPPLDLRVHESIDVEGIYTRKLISYNVEADERAHAFLAIPCGLTGPAPAIVDLHGTYPRGKERSAGLEENPDKAFLDQLARRGYIVIAPDHFVAGERIPPEGAYDTTRFYRRHPEWTAVGKFTYEHSIAVDVLQSLPEVDAAHIGVMGHSLGGQGTYFLAAYDERIQAAACNCAAPTFRHNAHVLEWARDRWYVYLKHLRPDLLAGKLPPIDMHQIVALIAPRPFLDLSALNDGNWQTQQQRVLMNMKIMEVYALEGVPENFAFYVHGRGHSAAFESRELIYGWLDVHLKPPAATTAHRLDPAQQAARSLPATLVLPPR